ncbi:hypothetical protein KC361_g822 [Hortaea werneckii]|nr:hypothetical protein KC361_g822 [Hortaea werneckii]
MGLQYHQQAHFVLQPFKEDANSPMYRSLVSTQPAFWESQPRRNAQDLKLALQSQRPHHAVRGGHLIKCEPGLRLSDATTKDVGLDSKLCTIFGTTNVSTGPEDSSARPVIKPFTISRTYDDIGKSTIKIPSRSITAHLRHASIIVKALIEMIT